MLQIFPKGIENQDKNFMSLFMKLTDCPLPSIDTKWEISILDKSKNSKRSKRFEYQYIPHAKNIYGWPRFLARATLFDQKNELIGGDNTVFLHGRVCEKSLSFLVLYFNNKILVFLR
jgi:hypothetical protein